MHVKHVEELCRFFDRAGTVLGLTGAGISTGSNIPDYRGPTGMFLHSAIAFSGPLQLVTKRDMDGCVS
jgi:NAD-dependent SIR2 family protein deacetylase